LTDSLDGQKKGPAVNHEGIEHVGLSVSNLDRSLEFYTEIIGLDLVRILDCPPEMGLGSIIGVPGAAARIAHLESDGAMLELFEYGNPRGKAIASEHTQADHGFIHIGLRSTDVRQDYRRLEERGVEFLGEPVEFRPGVWVVYFKGPDGEVCELRQT